MKSNFNSKKLKYGSVATTITVIVVAVIVLVNVIVSLFGERINMKVDLTSESIFEISDITKDYLKTINEEVEIVAFTDELVFSNSGSLYYKQAYEVLKKYVVNSDKVTLKFVDMTKDPTYVNKFSELYKGTITDYNIVVATDKRIRVLTLEDLYNIEINYQTYSSEITSSKAEQTLTSAVMYVTDADPMSAVMLTADSVSTSSANIASLLTTNGFDVSSINPLLEAIPMDADMIVIDAPVNDFSEEIIEQLYLFMENDGNYGKNMIYLASYAQNNTTNIDAFLAEWGIKVEKGVLAESNTQNLASSTSPYALRNYITENDYTENVAQGSLPFISFQASPITLLFENLTNVNTVSLLATEDTAYAVTNEMIEQINQGVEPTFEYKVYNTIALSNKYTFNENNEQVLSNVLVFGSSLMLDESFTNTPYYNNGDYFISIISKMTGKANGINIVPKNLSTTTFDMDVSKYNTSRTIFLIILPVAVLVFGLIVWLRRRHK